MTTLVGGGTLPVGTILSFGGGTVPDGFLLCNGALINRNDFAALFAVIGTNWGTTSGTDFRVPTCNGNLLKGRAIGSGADPDRNSRTAVQTGGTTGDNVGSLQTWRVQSHRHSTYIRNTYAGGTIGQSPQANYLNGEGRGGFGNTTPLNYNKVCFGSNVGGNGGVSGGGATAFNGNVNLNDSSPNNNLEYATQSYYINTNNTGSNQTTGRNVYVDFIIKY